MGYLSPIRLMELGLKSFGKDVLISDKASIYNAKNISIGNNVRIDDYCIISAGDGGIWIGSNIHIACYASMIGGGRITLEDFTNLAQRSTILSSNDDYSGRFFIGPTMKEDLRNVHHAPVTLRSLSILGVGCTVLPGVELGYNSCVGAMSLVKDSIPENQVWVGIPAKFVKMRKSLIVDYSDL